MFGREKPLGVLRVVVDDVGAEYDLATGLSEQLAHLERDGTSEFVDSRMHQRGSFRDDRRARGERHLAPRLEALRGGADRFIELLVRHLRERLEGLAVVRIYALVGHLLLFQWCCRGSYFWNVHVHLVRRVACSKMAW